MKLRLTYFKARGKFYSGPEILAVGAESWHEAIEEVRELQHEGDLPGVRSGREFMVLVEEIRDDGSGVPHVLHPIERPEATDDLDEKEREARERFLMKAQVTSEYANMRDGWDAAVAFMKNQVLLAMLRSS